MNITLIVTQNIVTMTICSQYGSIIIRTVLLASIKPQLFMSSFRNERKSLKINKALVSHFLLLLPADLPALSLKEWVRTPVKVIKAQFYS